MFLCILFFPEYSFYHIIIHGLFKFLLFLISGSLIYVQLNFQLIYKIKVNNLLIKIGFILGVCVLILSLSKEGIIHLFYLIIILFFIFYLLIIGGMLTCFYSSKLIKFCFNFAYLIFICYLFYNYFVNYFYVKVLLIVNKIFKYLFKFFNYLFIFNLLNLEFLFSFLAFYILERIFLLVFVFIIIYLFYV